MGCESFVRIILIILNIIFMLFGFAILGVSIWFKVDSDSLFGLFDNLPKDVGAVRNFFSALFGIGIGISSVCLNNSWMGFVGAAARHKVVLYIFALLVSIVLITEITGVALAAVFSSQIQDILTKQTAPLFKEYQATYTLTSGSTYTYGADDVTSRAIDALQIRYECCGINGYQDFYNNTVVFPVTCCPIDTEGRGDLAKSIFHTDKTTEVTVTDGTCPNNSAGLVNSVNGCYDKLEDTVKNKAGAVLGVLIAAAVFQIMLVIMAIYLGKKSPKRDGCCGGPLTYSKDHEMS